MPPEEVTEGDTADTAEEGTGETVEIPEWVNNPETVLKMVRELRRESANYRTKYKELETRMNTENTTETPAVENTTPTVQDTGDVEVLKQRLENLERESQLSLLWVEAEKQVSDLKAFKKLVDTELFLKGSVSPEEVVKATLENYPVLKPVPSNQGSGLVSSNQPIVYTPDTVKAMSRDAIMQNFDDIVSSIFK